MIAYDQDELLCQIVPATGEPDKQVGPFKLWFDPDGTVKTVAIESYVEQLDKFRKNRNVIKLKGMWSGISITETDIQQTRKDLIEKLEKRW